MPAASLTCAHKCAQHNRLLGDIHIASRTSGKCQAIIDSIRDKRSLQGPGVLRAHALDALDVEATEALIRDTQCQIVINVGTSFINSAVLAACIESGAAYLDTAIHEDPDKVCETPPWYANHEWKGAGIARRPASRRCWASASTPAWSTPTRAWPSTATSTASI